MQRRSVLALPLVAGLFVLAISCAKPATIPIDTCPGTTQSCNGTCVDTTSDNDNCGACGKSCGNGQLCQGGSCQCQDALTTCGSACVTTGSDPNHCGGCNTKCSAGQVCSLSVCGTTCAAGLANCSGACVFLMGSDPANCGTCGKACGQGQSCTMGVCGCPVGSSLCGNTCVNTSTSTTNCGTCGKVCGGTQVCTLGNCVCPAGQVPCSNGTSCAATAAQCPTTGTGVGGTQGTGTGGMAGGGTGGAAGTGSGRPAACAAAANVIADFEDGTGTVVPQATRTGWWYVFADALGGSVSPSPSSTGPVAVESTGLTDPCNKWAMHSKAMNRTGTSTSAYVGFGASLSQIMPAPPAGAKSKNPYDVSTYKGISFDIKSGSGAAPPIWFEILNTESQPGPDGLAGTQMAPTAAAFNTRGKLLSNITTTSQTVFVPFGLLGPRYLPAGAMCAGMLCEAPAWNPKTALGLQFSMYPQFTPSTSYDLWVDNVKFVSDDSGVATFTPSAGTVHPFPFDLPTANGCAKPAGATGKFLVDAYLRWKSTFVTGTGSSTRVQRPENGNDTVSEGIGYGMLIAVIMGDRTLFDGLWGYYQGNSVGGLMTWCIQNGGGSCNPNGGGSATDADEDVAYALIQAGKQWPTGTYGAQAAPLIGQIWSGDIDATALLPKGGSNYSDVNTRPTNPSYFAPAYYRIFALIDTAAGHNWTGVANKVYTALNATNNSGLWPAWCKTNCTAVGTNGGPDDMIYQYDAHRIPWRLSLDACWNGNASAKSLLSANTSFFVGKSATAGLGSVSDIYTLGGTPNGDAKTNSMSAVASAGAGAMANPTAANQDFLNRAYRFVLDANYTSDPAARMTAYTYFNATVGLLGALTMSGNFPNF
jgi:endo-1,4-beta-D-glucanase Y